MPAGRLCDLLGDAQSLWGAGALVASNGCHPSLCPGPSGQSRGLCVSSPPGSGQEALWVAVPWRAAVYRPAAQTQTVCLPAASPLALLGTTPFFALPRHPRLWAVSETPGLGLTELQQGAGASQQTRGSGAHLPPGARSPWSRWPVLQA